MLERVRREPCKKVATLDAAGRPNGYLIELYVDGRRTVAYLTAALPKAFKGFHLHTVRASEYVCLKGTMKITVVEGRQKAEYVLQASPPERLFLPPQVWIGLENIGEEEAWLVNRPHPPYDPDLKDEQQEKTPAEILAQVTDAAA